MIIRISGDPEIRPFLLKWWLANVRASKQTKPKSSRFHCDHGKEMLFLELLVDKQQQINISMITEFSYKIDSSNKFKGVAWWFNKTFGRYKIYIYRLIAFYFVFFNLLEIFLWSPDNGYGIMIFNLFDCERWDFGENIWSIYTINWLSEHDDTKSIL